MRLWRSDPNQCPRCKGKFSKWEIEAYNVSIGPPNHKSDLYLQHWVAYRQLRHCATCGHTQVEDLHPGVKK